MQDYEVNPALILADQETLELIDALNGHPYDTPALASYIPDVNGVSWTDIKAVGLVERYKDITNEQIAQICRNIIETYFMKSRGCQVKVYIKVATSTRLYFAVALSEDGKRFLNSQEPSAAEPVSDRKIEGLTETVPERSPETERTQLILGYRMSDYQEYGLKVPVSITLAKQTSSILIAGKSGSGKSLSARWYLWQMLSSGESAVYISDYKAGEEYEMFEGLPAYASGSDAVQMILDFYDFFTESQE